MIAANVAAAEALEKRRWPCMYRVHDQPDPVARRSLARVPRRASTCSLAARPGDPPQHFTQLLQKAKGTPYADMISTPGAALAVRRRSTRRRISATSAWRSAAMRISPRRSGAMPICWCIAR